MLHREKRGIKYPQSCLPYVVIGRPNKTLHPTAATGPLGRYARTRSGGGG